MFTAEHIIEDAADTYRTRSALYGNDGFIIHGKVMAALFPEGLSVVSAEDFARLALFDMMVAKLCRYAKSFHVGGHKDSAHDLGVYSFIMEAYDDYNNRTGTRAWSSTSSDDPTRAKAQRDSVASTGSNQTGKTSDDEIPF